MNFLYPVKISKSVEGQGFLAQCVDIPEVSAQGKSLDETIRAIQIALSEELSSRISNNIDLPSPSVSEPDEGHVVAPSAHVQAAALIRHQRATTGINMAELARRLETSWASARKLEQPDHQPTLRTLEKAAERLDMQLVLSFIPKLEGG